MLAMPPGGDARPEGEATPMRSNRASPTRRGRAAMEELRVAITTVLLAEKPCTVRQVYYQLVALGAIDKTEGEYKQTVCRVLAEMRREGRIPYWWIADNTRWQRKPRTWPNLTSALESTQQHYRRALWDDQDAYVEIWLEKDALSGVLYDVTGEWDVPLMVTRGFASLSFLHAAAEAIAAAEKPAFLYYFGDHDPSGVLIDRKVEEDLRKLAPSAEINFERVAVTSEQIGRLQLPSRPTKRDGNKHARQFVGNSYEVDSIAPSGLRAICRQCITRHIDDDRYQRTLRAEQAERDTLARMIRGGLS